jgi:sigma-B regulation protein RsbU (phosphoserine phosphatase)
VETLAVLVVLVVLGVLGVAISAAANARHAIEVRGNQLGPANTLAAALLADFTDEETGVRGFIVTQDPSYLSPFRTAQERLPGRYAALADQLRDEPDLLRRLDRVRVDHEGWVRNVAEKEIEAGRRGDFAGAAGIERRGEGRVRFDLVRSSLSDLQSGIQAARDVQSQRIRDAQNALLATLVAAVVLVLALTGAATLVVSRALVRPFNRVRRAVDAVAAGDLQIEVPTPGPREVAELGASVETMRARLVESLAESRRAVEALTQQGPAVIALRDALAPTRTTSSALVVVGRLDPAEGVLAGDWYDALDLPGGRVGLIVGDVSGHGPGPGVFALRLKHLLAAALATGMTPGMSVEWVVAQLGDTGEMFATAIVLVVDPATGRIDYTNAGHPEPIVLRADGSAPVTLDPTGPMLTRMLTSPGAWASRQLFLEPNDLLLAYTDGVVEARRGDEQLGTAGLCAQLEKVRTGTRSLDPQRLLDEVFAHVNRYAAGPATDDRTALAVARAPVGTDTGVPSPKAPPSSLRSGFVS